MNAELEIIYYDNCDHCVMCGRKIPEGKQYCYFCEKENKEAEEIV